MEQNERLIITPKTKVLQLLEAYPELEETLIACAPPFKKLKNPVLRKTVAKIATLQQAAAIGNMKVDELVNILRKEVGQDLLAGETGHQYNTVKPAWFREDRISKELDAREMIEAGDQPVNQVIADLNQLPDGSIYKLIAPFLPAPLIDKATSLSLSHWVDHRGAEEYYIYFAKQ